jgi:hypothetical protein
MRLQSMVKDVAAMFDSVRGRMAQQEKSVGGIGQRLRDAGSLPEQHAALLTERNRYRLVGMTIGGASIGALVGSVAHCCSAGLTRIAAVQPGLTALLLLPVFLCLLQRACRRCAGRQECDAHRCRRRWSPAGWSQWRPGSSGSDGSAGQQPTAELNSAHRYTTDCSGCSHAGLFLPCHLRFPTRARLLLLQQQQRQCGLFVSAFCRSRWGRGRVGQGRRCVPSACCRRACAGSSSSCVFFPFCRCAACGLHCCRPSTAVCCDI